MAFKTTCGDLALLEQVGEALGLLDRDRADQDRLPLLAQLHDLIGERVVLLALGAVDHVLVILPDHRHVGRDDHDFELVDLVELRRLGVRGAGHARELLVEPEVVLERDGRERLVLALDLDVLLGFDGLVEPVGPPAAGEDAARELVDDQDLAVADHVVDVPLVERVRAQGLLDAVEQVDVLQFVHVLDAEKLLGLGDAFLRQDGRARLLVDQVVAGGRLVAVLVLLLGALGQVRDHAVARVVDLGVLFGGPRDDERGARLVDQDRVDLVDDREDVAALHHVLELELHVVAEVVEAELVVGAVGHVARVRGLALVVEQVVLDAAHRQPQEPVDLAHPVRVAPGEVVVHGDDVHAPAGQGVQVHGHGRDEGLALAGLHLGDLSRVQDHPADQLHVEGAKAQGAHGGFASDRERLLEQLVQDGRAGLLEVVLVDLFERLGDPLPELDGLRPQRLVGQRLHRRLERVDPLDARRELLQVALVLRAENSGEEAIDHD